MKSLVGYFLFSRNGLAYFLFCSFNKRSFFQKKKYLAIPPSYHHLYDALMFYIVMLSISHNISYFSSLIICIMTRYFFLVLWFGLVWPYLVKAVVTRIQPPTQIFVYMLCSFILVIQPNSNMQQPRSFAVSATSIISSFSPCGTRKKCIK